MTRSAIVVFMTLLLCGMGAMAANYQIEDQHCRYALDSSTKTATVMKFIGKTSTKTVNIPDNIMNSEDGKTYKVTEIAPAAFYKSNVVTVNFPATLKEIGAGAFESCPRLSKGVKLELPINLQTIGMEAFKNCLFTDVDIPSSVTLIDQGAFENTKLRTVKFSSPKSSLTIGDFAFCDCVDLQSVKLPSKVTKLGYESFSRCVSLTSVTLPSTVTAIPTRCFMQCTALSSIVLPSGVKSVGESAFARTGIKTIQIPATVTKLGQSSFAGSALTSVTIPAGITTIPWSAFSGCASLASVVLPATLKKIESGAFFECPALMSIRCDATVPPAVADEAGFSAQSYASAKLILPSQSVPAYSAAEVWKKFKWFLTSGINEIEAEDAAAEAEYYTLQGVRVDAASLIPGIYIRHRGASIDKINIR